MSDREHSTGCQTASKCDRDRCEFCCECHVRLRGPSGPTAEVLQLRAELAKLRAVADAAAKYAHAMGSHPATDGDFKLWKAQCEALDTACPDWRTKEGGR